jgi:hypothetical protein
VRLARGRQRASILLGAAVLALLAAGPAAAVGEDPASVYLVRQATFLSPGDGHVPPAQARTLTDLVRDARGQGYRLRVAVIASRYDLLRAVRLFGHPQTYAKVLGEEDYYFWKDELLVVMPSGFGVYRAGGAPLADTAVLHGIALPAHADGARLVEAAGRAVRALASRRGLALSAWRGAHSLPRPGALSPQGALRWDLEGLLLQRLGAHVVLETGAGAVTLARGPCRGARRCGTFRFMFAQHASTRFVLLSRAARRSARSGAVPVRVLDRDVACAANGSLLLVEHGSGQTARLACAPAGR